MKFKKLSLATTTLFVLSNLIFALPVRAAQNVKATTSKTYTFTRISGANRIDTAANIANNCYSSNVNDVVLTTAYNFPDALSGSVLAAKLGAPVLSVGYGQKDSVSTFRYILTHLNKGGTIHILGGTGVVNKTVENLLTALDYKIDRISGATRFETAAKICDKIAPAVGTPVFLAIYDNYPDALSASAIAAINGYPILLSQKSSLPNATFAELQKVQPSTVYIVGGTGTISDNIKTQIKSAVTGIQDTNIVRIAGANRFATSIAIAQYFNLDTTNAVITTGYNYPDALAGSILACKMNAPMILVGKKGEVSAQKQYLDSSTITNLYILGGQSTISDEVVKELTAPVIGS